jgi:gluconate kinase
VFNERLVKLLSEGKNVIVDNLNLKKKYRAALKETVKGLDVRVTYVYMVSPSLETNIQRRPTFEIGVIDKMTEILDWPSRDEYDELWVSKAIQA